MVRLAKRLGLPALDVSALMSSDGQGYHLGIVAPHPRVTPVIDPARARAMRAFAGHVGAALRLRRSLQSLSLDDAAVAGIWSPAGALRHAGPSLAQFAPRRQLRHAVLGRARAARARYDVESLDLWEAVISGRWSLVDRFDTDGRHFVVAYHNAVDQSPRALTRRERHVAEAAARGHSNKVIAADLGLGVSTVASYLSATLEKLGLKSRLDLIRELSPALRGMPMQVGGARLAVAERELPKRPEASDLTPAERAVVDGTLAGLSNAEVAIRRGTSPRTIANQLASVLRKLGVGSRYELAAALTQAEQRPPDLAAGVSD
jgi:DNA-binding NarL/FixJ family response regulator